ncbi:MAG: Bro-N domain-containing protein [Clostridia bacterium]|nr:Bro-N domain-containing protein [Clostridia bacterium]
MSDIKIFNDKNIRTMWDAEKEQWFFSVVDVVEVLSGSIQPRKYWNDLKKKLKNEGSELSEKIGRFRLVAQDGKLRETDILNTEGILRLVQSIPSPKAEPFKRWLAKVGNERLDEISDPEKAMQRGVNYYREKGYPEEWITQRMMSIKIRKDLTAEWKERGITNEKDYAILTNEMMKAWSELSVKEYKEQKNLKKESLRDNMTDIELVLNMLAEVTTTTLSKQEKPITFKDNKTVARRGGSVAKVAKHNFEKETGTKAVSNINAKNKNLLEVKKRNKDDQE